MSETRLLVTALKRELTNKGITYKHLAKRLKLSEASIKRIFSQYDFTMERFESICAVAGTTFLTLMHSASQLQPPKSVQMTVAWEEALADDHDLFTLFHLLLHGHSVKKIMRDHQLSRSYMTRKLVQLDRIGLIDFKENDNITLHVAAGVRWRPAGALFKKYGPQVREQFLKSDFLGEGEFLRFVSSSLSTESRNVISRKVNQLVREIEELAELDVHEATDGKVFGILLAFRPMDFDMRFKNK